jgi:hypothetical protein
LGQSSLRWTCSNRRAPANAATPNPSLERTATEVLRQPHRFEFADSTQTLAEALAEYYAANPELKRGEALAPEARAFFEPHDVIHVVYGCSTTMPDEAVVKLSSMFGTTAGIHALRGYMLYESLDIYRKLPLGSTLVALLAAPYLIGRTIWRCVRQRAKWPWGNHEQYMHTPLRELRVRFGIKVAHALTQGA